MEKKITNSKSRGLPYKGSKNRLADWIVGYLPEADVLYDVFAGGCAVTHAALLSGKYKKIVANDINDVPTLFKDALDGKYKDHHPWVSREEFLAKKDTDPYVAVVYSFGNNMKDYLYSRDIEPYKKAVHEMIYTDTPNGRRLAYRKVVRELLKYMRKKGLVSDNGIIYNEAVEHGEMVQGVSESALMQNQQLERKAKLDGLSEDRFQLENGIRTNQLNKLARGGSDAVEVSKTDYRSLDIPAGALVYCDPPYKGTGGYGVEFDHEAFYDWCRGLSARGVSVFVSEYAMPDDFKVVAERPHRVKINDKNCSVSIERLFTI